ncbi:MAG: hypothetical protein WEB37_02030 [Bacteroidota bacterium]
MSNKPERFDFETSSEKKDKDGLSQKTKTRVSWDTIDIIASFAGLVALLIVIGMLSDLVPINRSTVALASLSGLGAVVMGVRRSANKNTDRDRN